jgi:maleate isomerase
MAGSVDVAELPIGPLPQTPLGVIASFDFDRDRELWRWVPDDVSLLIDRTDPAPRTDNLTMVSALNDPAMMDRPARIQLGLGVRAVLYACTACSFVGGLAGERALCDALLAVGVPDAVTTSGAVLEALRAVGSRRVAVVHPYAQSVGARLDAFLTEAGIDVVASRGWQRAIRAAHADYRAVAELAVAGDAPDADALFISCTALPTYDLIAPLEARLGKPVITANQAGMWALLRRAEFAAVGPDQALTRATPRATPR